jgi:hypothetical protein
MDFTAGTKWATPKIMNATPRSRATMQGSFFIAPTG